MSEIFTLFIAIALDVVITSYNEVCAYNEVIEQYNQLDAYKDNSP